MRRRINISSMLLLLLVMTLGQGCIHEYPYPVKGDGNLPGVPGNDPTTMKALLEVSFDLSWESMLHHIEFQTRTKTPRTHRFVIEVKDGNQLICRDIEYLTDEDFANGIMRHRLSTSLYAKPYDVAVWYDNREVETPEYSFEANDLQNVRLLNRTTTDAELQTCGFASDVIDLSDVTTEDEDHIVKSLELGHAGARFEIIATDVNEFIAEQKAALLQGDTFSANIEILSGGTGTFNLHSCQALGEDDNLELTGRMRLPYDEYDELKIAEGFFFCSEESDVTAKLSVKNNSLVVVSQTEIFTFPVKRGYITTIRGNFLTHPLNGVFSIDNIWEGVIEINYPEP